MAITKAVSASGNKTSGVHPTVKGDRTVTLRIKRTHLEAIQNGTKEYEYRELTSHYAAMFSKPFNLLKLHYQSGLHLLVEVTRVEYVEFQGETMFRLALGKVFK